MTEKLGVNEKEPAFGQKTPTTTTTIIMSVIIKGACIVLIKSRFSSEILLSAD